MENFKVINEILTEEDFDNYEASEQFIRDINLIRFYLKSLMKSSFTAYNSFLKFYGNILYENGARVIISLGVMKNNGIMYFGKNIEIN